MRSTCSNNSSVLLSVEVEVSAYYAKRYVEGKGMGGLGI